MPVSGSSRPKRPRGFSSQLKQHRASTTGLGYASYGTMEPTPGLTRTLTHSEVEHLLEAQHEDEDHADSDGLYPPHCCWTNDQPAPPAKADPFGNRSWPVYHNIHRIRREIIITIDDPYSMEQLKAPRMNLTVIRPLVDQFYDSGDLSMVYCLLVNRTEFIREQSYATHHQTVNLTRALVCEIIAEKILRRYNEHNPGPKGLLKLANILVAGFEPFQGAPEDVIEQNEHALHLLKKRVGQHDRAITALEIAIVSESKSFLASTACQKVVDAIYRGKIVYTPNSFIDIIADHWKRRPISLYDPRRAPLLNQYRLIVPRTRNAIEIGHFIILLILYLVVMDGRETRLTTAYTPIEVVFDVFAAGWILDQFATMLEHGWKVYTQNLWVFLDVMFSAIFIFYISVRIHASLCTNPDDALLWARLSLDALSCAAPVLIPRLAFNVMSENMVFLCLRSMMSDFLNLVLLAIWCFVGFLLSLKWLHNGVHEEATIGKWMIWIWFGLDGTGIEKAQDFHWLLGPVIMVMFAFLGNTLFLTILVSMLSNTFSTIAANSVQEFQFRRAVLTFEGVKSDAIFAYMPPFNIMALLIVLPLKLVTSPRWFHKLNVAAVKVLNAPLLLLIGLYERRVLWISNRDRGIRPKKIDWNNPNGPHILGGGLWSRTFQFWEFARFSVHGDIHAVFEDPPPGTPKDAEEGHHFHKGDIGRTLRQDFLGQFGDPKQQRRASTVPSEANAGQERRKQDRISEEFQTSDTDGDGDDESEHPSKFHPPKRPARRDSLIDFDGENTSIQEANARLHKLEASVQKIEALLLQLLNSDEPSKEEEAAEEDVDPAIQE